LVEPLEARHLLAANPLISEFLARNDGLVQDGDGETPDYIEIYNGGNEPIDLAGYRLTDDLKDLSKWVFPHVELGAGEFMLVFASGQDSPNYADAAGHLHTNFGLKGDGEFVALVGPHNAIVSQYGTAKESFPEQLSNVSYGIAQSVRLVAPDSRSEYLVPGRSIGNWQAPDFDATSAGFIEGTAALGLETSTSSRNNFSGEFQTELPRDTLDVYVRIPFELADPSAITNLTLRLKYDDGYAAYLNGVKVSADNAPDVLDWFSTARERINDADALEWSDVDLSDHVGQLRQGTNVLALHGLNHLSDKGDMLLVAELTAGAADLEAVTGTPARVGYMTTPTPGAPNVSNAEIFDGFVADTKFSLEHGFFDSPQTVAITTATQAAQIFYTTDGSPPSPGNPSATPYVEPLTINTTTSLRAAAFLDRYIPSNIDTQTYLFLNDVLKQSDQSALDAGFPSRWGVQTPDYEMDQTVVGEYGAEAIKQSLLSVPTVAITVNNDDLFGTQGIYTQAESRGADYERPASIEWLNPDGSQGFQIDAGIRIQGGAFRSYSLTHKNSFRLLFKGVYGDTKLDYPVFGTGDDVVQEFDNLTLRMEANDGWQWADAGGQPQFARDEFHRRTQRLMGQPSGHGTFIQVYINGLYWGHYNVVERPDASFAEAYLGVDKDDWDGFNAAFDRGSVTNADGDRAKQDRAVEAWNTMLRQTRDIRSARTEEEKTALFMALQGKNPDGSPNPSQRAHLDVDNYIDYMILNHWGANTDWPQKNFYVGGENSPDSDGFKFFSWDAEWTLTLRNSVTENRLRDVSGVAAPFQGLQQSEEFRVAWSDRVHKHLFNGGALYVDPVNPHWDPGHPERNVPAATYVQITEEVFDPILAESARWGDQHRRARAYTRDREWQAEKEKLLENWFPQRSGILLNQYKAANLYPKIDAPVFNQHGGTVSSDFLLSIANPGSGVILYTLDGSDPRLVGGAENPKALRYQGEPITLIRNATVKARVLDNGQWSALDEATFVVNDFRITEIGYHPHPANLVPGVQEPNVDGDDFEFVEFANVGRTPLDVSNYRFTDGIEFTIPENTTIVPAERLLIVKNKDAFEARYGAGNRILGQYAGNLSNEGERLRMVDREGQTVLSFQYGVDRGWPSRADGKGSTLEIVDIKRAPSSTNWKASSQYGGSPGAPAAEPSPIRFNEVLANSKNNDDQIELTNDANHKVDISGWFITDNDEQPFKFKIPQGESISAFGFATFSQSQLGFGLNGSRGGQLTLIEADRHGQPQRFADHIEYGGSLPGVSLGPWPNPHSPWAQLAEPTFGATNAQPRSGDVVITEILYNPADPDGAGTQRDQNFKFIELFNTTNRAIDLAGWQLKGSATFNFDQGSVIGPGETALLVPFRSTSRATNTVFTFAYQVPQDTVFFYQYAGSPEQGNSSLTLVRPGEASADDPDFVPTLIADQVDFDLRAPWPTTQVGQSLQRVSVRATGSLPSNWIVAAPTAGAFQEAVPFEPGDSNRDGQFDQRDIVEVLQAAHYLTGQPATFSEGDWNGDGVFDQRDIVTALQTGNYLRGPYALSALDAVFMALGS
jgi:hypothetical protein